MKIVAIMLFVIILMLDVLYHVIGGKRAYLINGINFVMHIALLFNLLILDLELKYAVLAFLASLFTYSLAFLVKGRANREERDDV